MKIYFLKIRTGLFKPETDMQVDWVLSSMKLNPDGY